MTDHSSAFMALEPKLSNLSSMARITFQLAMDVGNEPGGDVEEKNDLIFASRELCNMAEQLLRDWHADLKKSDGHANCNEAVS